MHTRITGYYNRFIPAESAALLIKKVNAALVDHAYNQSPLALLTSLLCAIIVLFGYSDMRNTIMLAAWFSQFLIVTFLRFVFVKVYSHQKNSEKNTIIWRNLFIFSAFLGGLSWGLSALMLLPYGTHLQQALIIFILSGMTAGAVPLLSAIRSAVSAFLIPAGVPLMFHFFIRHNEIYYLFDTAVALYLFSMIILSFKIHNLIQNTIYLKFQNDELVKNLMNAADKLEYAATHDPLTQIANRNLFETNFEQALTQTQNEKQLLALLYIDLDDFKAVNDQYGHHVGDQLLQATVNRMKRLLPKSKLISRLGGDEFAVIMENTTFHQAAALADQICRSLNEPIHINNLELKVSASIGISVYPTDGKDITTLLKAADKAMYYAKQHGCNKFHFNTAVDHIAE